MATCSNPKFKSLASFGPPKECDSSGVIGSSSRSLIEGFLQVNVPKEILKKNIEEKDDNENDEIGEAFYVNDHDQNREFPYFWCKIENETFIGYDKLHSDGPVFTLSVGEIQIRENGPWTFDLVSYNDTFSIRTTNRSLLALWRRILMELQDGKLQKK